MRRFEAWIVLVIVAVVLAGPWQSAEAQTSIAGMEVHRQIDYIGDASYADERDRLDVFMPSDAEGVPVVVFFHGGGLVNGDKSQGEFVAKGLVPRGIGVVSANYRLSPGVMHPAHLQDAAAAFAWTVEQISEYGGDPERVYLAGHSAGAYMAALLALDDSYLGEAGVTLSAVRGAIPISPFLYVEEVAPDRPTTVWGADPAIWRSASPSTYFRDGKPALLFVYADGDADWRREQIERGATALTAAGQHDVATAEIPDRTHSSVVEQLAAPGDPGAARIAEFVLRPAHGTQ
ncbi:MAG: alpha/beta hydrolase [Vicinamibacterales bacterium]|jgi:acetyl esterase/lipase|nr:alpha/beta hydrolase [Vicinamibacterales bacterium]MDP6610434.1 alpha/beta hydrolase [Vicinamibacterales bacterium]|tara:strand:- start:2694 stop:3563 length:870 start_codon:yes stop_codon:yes gene_type:complete